MQVIGASSTTWEIRQWRRLRPRLTWRKANRRITPVNPATGRRRKAMQHWVRRLFGMRRKALRNSLGRLWGTQRARSALAACGQAERGECIG